jgi:Ca-activated chloride channel family protein
MSLLAPAALALGLLALPIILLYMLRLRRREQPVSSTWLWRELVRDRAANAPWQRLRRNLLLLLQLLILAALVLALARPALPLPGLGGGNAIVLLDASASMQAADGTTGTRFDDARAAVDRLIGGLSGNDRLTLIHVGRAPQVLAAASADRSALRRALAAAAPENAAADWAAAFALAAGSAQGLADPRIVIVSDGGLPDGLPPLPGEVSFVPVGRAGDNLAISAQAARPSGGGADLLVVVDNPGTTPRSALLSLTLDGALYDSRRIELDAGGQSAQTWSLPDAAGVVEARLAVRDSLPDYLPLDDRAWTLLDAGTERRVLLISEGNLFLERFFAVLPGAELFRATPDEAGPLLAEAGLPFDIVVYDGVPLPPGPLPGNALVFNPQNPPAADEGDAPLLTTTDVFTATTAVRVADDPLLANVDWRALSVAEAQLVEAPRLETLVEAEGGPLLLAGEVDGRRVAVFAFDLRASDLPLQIAFPVIVANITAWLSPGRAIAADDNLQPGATVSLLPDTRAASVTVTLPDGSAWQQDIDRAAPVLFDQTQQTGVYRLAFRDDTGATQPGGAFAVNFFDAVESRIQPATALQLGSAEVTGDAAGLEGLREVWPWLLAGGLVVLLVEWWVTYRRALRRPLLRTR